MFEVFCDLNYDISPVVKDCYTGLWLAVSSLCFLQGHPHKECQGICEMDDVLDRVCIVQCSRNIHRCTLIMLPFYYEVKILFVIWLLLPVTKGSSHLYKRFVHPHFAKREKDIDEYIDQYSKKGYTTLLSLGTRGLTYATNVVVTTAIKGQSSLVDHIRKSYSTNDLRVGEDTVDGHHPSFMLDDDELDERIAQDNREIEKRKPLRRSTSDVTEIRPPTSRYKNPPTELSKVEEVEEEYMLHEESSIHVRPGYYSPKQVRLDPYGTLPRTRARTRSKLPK